MWFKEPPTATNWQMAERHLRRVDSQLGKIIRRVGHCTLSGRRDYFVALCKSIFAQQLSTRVATVLFGRFRGEFPRQRPTPALLLALFDRDPQSQKRCGLSRQKAVYLRDLSGHFIEGRIRTRRLASMTDEQIIEALSSVKGVGRWTAEMFLIFVLSRLDVLPVDDLGLREAVREVYGLPRRPTAAELTRLAEPWRPYRSVATWYLWRRAATAPKKSARKTAS